MRNHPPRTKAVLLVNQRDECGPFSSGYRAVGDLSQQPSMSRQDIKPLLNAFLVVDALASTRETVRDDRNGEADRRSRSLLWRTIGQGYASHNSQTTHNGG